MVWSSGGTAWAMVWVLWVHPQGQFSYEREFHEHESTLVYSSPYEPCGCVPPFTLTHGARDALPHSKVLVLGVLVTAKKEARPFRERPPVGDSQSVKALESIKLLV